MDVLSKPAWWIAFVLVGVHQLLQYGFGISLAIVDDYLDPLLAMPVLLGLILQERKWLFGRARLSGLECAVIVLVLSLLFEEGFPHWQPAFVHDPVDYVMYALGGIWFYLSINPEA